MPGYSGTPLAKKLSLKPGMRVIFEDMPPSVLTRITDDIPDLKRLARPRTPVDAIHLFATSAPVLTSRLKRARGQITQSGFIWVSWPKKSSKVPTDITEDTIRSIALPMGFVDIKVCAVDDIWSGLKLVIRKALREG
ncbi:MAG: hypothetical protein AAGB10_12865 [Pseudomonadota bacterium]